MDSYEGDEGSERRGRSNPSRQSSRLHTRFAILLMAVAGIGGLTVLATGWRTEPGKQMRAAERLQTFGKHLSHLAMVCQLREHHRQGDAALSHHDLRAARTEYEAAFQISRSLVEQEPENTALRRQLSMSYNRLGDLERAGGGFALAEQLFMKSLELRKALAMAAPQDAELQRDLSVSYSKLGKLAQDQGQPARARELVENSLTLTEALAKSDPQSVEHQLDLATNHLDMAALLDRVNDRAAYQAHHDAAGEILDRLDQRPPATHHNRFVMLRERLVQMRR